MRESMDVTQATFSADSNEPECPICLGPFTEPKIMLCGHITCRGCLITWVTTQLRQVGCPLCRHPMFQFLLVNEPEDFVALVVDCLPTEHVIMATARGKHDVTPDTCSGCEGLLCMWRSSPHPQCPGQDVQNTEADARAAMNDLTNMVQVMMEKSNKLQKHVMAMEAEFRCLVDVKEIEEEVQAQTWHFFNWLKTENEKLRSVLFTHQHRLKRMRDSHQKFRDRGHNFFHNDSHFEATLNIEIMKMQERKRERESERGAKKKKKKKKRSQKSIEQSPFPGFREKRVLCYGALPQPFHNFFARLLLSNSVAAAVRTLILSSRTTKAATGQSDSLSSQPVLPHQPPASYRSRILKREAFPANTHAETKDSTCVPVQGLAVSQAAFTFPSAMAADRQRRNKSSQFLLTKAFPYRNKAHWFVTGYGVE
ncbi:hypothetical protein C0Q70_14513, partial [Pomacea canaliculata]